MLNEKSKNILISSRINSRVKRLADGYYKSNGLIFSRFLEDAILDKLEEVIASKEIGKLRREPTRPFEDVLTELGMMVK